MKFFKTTFAASIVSLLAGCASIPTGPTVAVMPAPGKPFEVFRADDAACREFAKQQLGANPNEVARQQVLSGAAAGAALGAVSGALLGHGRGGSTASGAGAGVIIGSAVGAGAAQDSTAGLQYRYNISYEQCMYAKGNQVPGYSPQNYPPPPR